MTFAKYPTSRLEGERRDGRGVDVDEPERRMIVHQVTIVVSCVASRRGARLRPPALLLRDDPSPMFFRGNYDDRASTILDAASQSSMCLDQASRFLARASFISRDFYWLAGLRDRYVGRALSLMHERPAHDWSVDDLAERVGLSRSALAQRFATLLRQPPMQYLTRWRLVLAGAALRSSNRAIPPVAEESGYESESAFNRAFKRGFGIPPAAWRRQGTQNSGGAVSSP